MVVVSAVFSFYQDGHVRLYASLIPDIYTFRIPSALLLASVQLHRVMKQRILGPSLPDLDFKRTRSARQGQGKKHSKSDSVIAWVLHFFFLGWERGKRTGRGWRVRPFVHSVE